MDNPLPYTIPTDISKDIFRAYDIRGVAFEQLSEDAVYAIGLAYGTEAEQCGQKKIAIGRDARLSGPALHAALMAGLMASGRDVIDLGVVATPMVYFATHFFATQSGIMLTGSHNPGEYNGIKMVLAGSVLTEAAIQDLYRRITSQDFHFAVGSSETVNIAMDYIERIAQDVQISKPLKIVVDAGNGVTGNIAPRLFRRLGCEVVELFCQPDGSFPHHHPDPSVAENLQHLRQAVLEQQADVGLAFDGDGDRLGVVTNAGEIIWPDRQMMLFVQDVLSRQPNAEILFDVKCTRNLAQVIAAAGGRPVMCRTGHSLIKAKMRETGAPLAGEMSGHIFFKERWYGFDDALYVGARLLELLSRDERSSSEIFAEFPDSINTPELKIVLADAQKNNFMQQFIQAAQFEHAHLSTIDGLRVEFADGWGLVRCSNTTPALVLRFEADDAGSLARIQQAFKQQLLQVDPSLVIPF